MNQINLIGQIGSAFSAILQLNDTPSGVAITGATAASPIVLTVADNDFTNGEWVAVTNCNEEADGVWIVASATATTFALTGTTGEVTTVGTNAAISNGLDCTGGSITFTAKGSTWTTGNSILAASANLSTAITAIEQFTFTWGGTLGTGQVISAANGQLSGVFTISLTAAQMTELGSGTFYYRIFYVDSGFVPTEQFRGSFTIQ